MIALTRPRHRSFQKSENRRFPTVAIESTAQPKISKSDWGAPEVQNGVNAGRAENGEGGGANTPSQIQAGSESGHPPIEFRDPLRWFGILVPPKLRESQHSFTSAIEGPLRHLIAAERGMWEIEVEIRKIRKAMKRERKA